VPWSQIAIANGLAIDAKVTPGKELLIPTILDPRKTAPQPSGQPSPQAAKAAANSAAAASAVASAAVAAATAPAGKTAARFAWPLEGTVRRGWKPNRSADRHDGIDIVAPRGTPVRAAAAGTVLFAGLEKEQFGNLVVLDHGDGWNTAYGFLSRVTVKQGAKVAAGERVGLVGDTGRARGNELHFEVRQDGAPIDPAPELPPAQ
jgi:murein DD-endopeptidase MepM/ murein hydrolase activator NlpD